MYYLLILLPKRYFQKFLQGDGYAYLSGKSSQVLFLIIKNKKDRKELESQLNQDYKKPREEEHTSDPDDIKNT